MDKGAWHTKVHEIAKRRIDDKHTCTNALSNLNFDSCFSGSEACEYECLLLFFAIVVFKSLTMAILLVLTYAIRRSMFSMKTCISLHMPLKFQCSMWTLRNLSALVKSMRLRKTEEF